MAAGLEWRWNIYSIFIGILMCLFIDWQTFLFGLEAVNGIIAISSKWAWEFCLGANHKDMPPLHFKIPNTNSLADCLYLLLKQTSHPIRPISPSIIYSTCGSHCIVPAHRFSTALPFFYAFTLNYWQLSNFIVLFRFVLIISLSFFVRIFFFFFLLRQRKKVCMWLNV